MNDYLMHHGILGQKWGMRNGPPYPLDAGDHSASERKAGWRKSLKNKKEEIENKVYEGAKIRIEADNPTLTGDQVDNRANTYIALGKAAITMGALAAVTYAGVKAYNYGRPYYNGKLRAGQVLQRIERYNTENPTLNEDFYASYKKLDNARYRDWWGIKDEAQAKRAVENGYNPILMKLKVVSPIKIANHKTAEKFYWQFKKEFESSHPDTALPDNYKFFNEHVLVNHGSEANQFYSLLKKNGYSAVMDMHNQTNVLNTKDPIIVFDKSAVKIDGLSELKNLPKGQKIVDKLVSGINDLDFSYKNRYAQYVDTGAKYAVAFGLASGVASGVALSSDYKRGAKNEKP